MSPRQRYNLVPIVEGDGEVTAVPALLRNWFHWRRFHNFDVPELAVKAHKGSLVAPYDPAEDTGIEWFIQRAAARRPDAILVILDADDDCIRRSRNRERGLGPELLERATTIASHIPMAIVVANREFEAWFLAAHRCLRHDGIFRHEQELEQMMLGLDVETPRDCKGMVGRQMGERYSPTTHQAVLAKKIGFRAYMTEHSPSFAKLLRDLDRITKQARQNRKSR